MKLKLIIAFVATVYSCAALTSCKKDEIAEQEKASIFYPRIFNDNILFPVPAITSTISVGQSKVFSGLTYSPANEVTITWKVDDTVVANTADYTFIGTTAGLFTIRLEVSYNNMVTFRTAKVRVN